MKDFWFDDKIQFARLLCELVANVPNLHMEEVAESMDLHVQQVDEIFDRAHEVWEESKKKHCK